MNPAWLAAAAVLGFWTGRLWEYEKWAAALYFTVGAALVGLAVWACWVVVA